MILHNYEDTKQGIVNHYILITFIPIQFISFGICVHTIKSAHQRVYLEYFLHEKYLTLVSNQTYPRTRAIDVLVKIIAKMLFDMNKVCWNIFLPLLMYVSN